MNSLYKIWVCFVTIILPLVGLTDVFAAENFKDVYSQGQEAANNGDQDKAIAMFEKTIELNPDFAPAYTSLGEIYMEKQGNLDDMIWLFQQAAQIDPQNPGPYADMCRAYSQYEKFDWAEAACLKALSLDSGSGPTKLTLTYVYLLGKNQPDMAIKYFNNILEQVQTPKLYYGLGMAYARNHEQAKTLEIITLLRHDGEEVLASQLEKMIRPAKEAIMPEPEPASPSESHAALPPDFLKPASAINPGNVSIQGGQPGSTRIKLKGKLSIAATGSSPSRAPEHSRPSTQEPIPPAPAPESAVERIKKMRGNGGVVRVRGNSSVQVQGTVSGTAQ